MNTNNLDNNTATPLYLQLKNKLQEDIENGRLAPGSKIPTEFEFVSDTQLCTQIDESLLRIRDHTVDPKQRITLGNAECFRLPGIGKDYVDHFAGVIENDSMLLIEDLVKRRVVEILAEQEGEGLRKLVEFQNDRLSVGSSDPFYDHDLLIRCKVHPLRILFCGILQGDLDGLCPWGQSHGAAHFRECKDTAGEAALQLLLRNKRSLSGFPFQIPLIRELF